jgi:hypothetical protein
LNVVKRSRLFAQRTECGAFQARHVHLAQTQDLADLPLGAILEKAYHQDDALTNGKCSDELV